MKPQEEKQVTIVITQLTKQKKSIPFLQHLDAHTLYGWFFHGLSPDERDDVKLIIRSYVINDIKSLKTKWGEMFQRFYELHEELFWQFRTLNSSEANTENPKFHEIGQEVEKYLYHFEQILTKNMMRRPEGLEKVTDAFYDIAYRFFPLYGRIESD